MPCAYAKNQFVAFLHRQCLSDSLNPKADEWIKFGGPGKNVLFVKSSPAKLKRSTEHLGEITADTVCHQLRNYRFKEVDCDAKGWRAWTYKTLDGVEFSASAPTEAFENCPRVVRTAKETKRPSERSVYLSPRKGEESDESDEEPIKRAQAPKRQDKRVRPKVVAKKEPTRIVRQNGNSAIGRRIPAPAENHNKADRENLVRELEAKNARLSACIERCLHNMKRYKEANGQKQIGWDV